MQTLILALLGNRLGSFFRHSLGTLEGSRRLSEPAWEPFGDPFARRFGPVGTRIQLFASHDNIVAPQIHKANALKLLSLLVARGRLSPQALWILRTGLVCFFAFGEELRGYSASISD